MKTKTSVYSMFTNVAALTALFLASLLVGCDSKQKESTPMVEVVDASDHGLGMAGHLLLIRLSGKQVKVLEAQLFLIENGETTGEKKCVFDGFGPDCAGEISVLEYSGEPFGKNYKWAFELSGNFNCTTFVADGELLSCEGDMKRGGSSQLVRGIIKSQESEVLANRIYWPKRGMGAGGQSFNSVEDAKEFTETCRCSVLLVTVRWE